VPIGVNCLRVLSLGTLKSLFLPGGVWLLIVVLLVYSGWLSLALPVLSFLYYCAIAGGMLLAWRFHSSRIFLSLLVVLVAQQGAAISVGQPPFIPATLQALAILVPVNFVLIELMHERGFTLESLAPVILFLFVQSLTLTVFCGAAVRVRSLSDPIVLPRYSMVVIASAATFLTVRFLLNRKPVDSAQLWSLGAFFLALRSAAATRTSMAYWATSACILATAVIENSYLLAYHDELTTLPSRRAFNDGEGACIRISCGTPRLRFVAAGAVPSRLGGLLQTAFRRPRTCVALSRRLHPSRRHFQQQVGCFLRGQRHLPLARLRSWQQEATDDSARR